MRGRAETAHRSTDCPPSSGGSGTDPPVSVLRYEVAVGRAFLRQLPPVVIAAIAAVGGVLLADQLSLPPGVPLAALWLVAAALFVPTLQRTKWQRVAWLAAVMAAAAACRWSLIDARYQQQRDAWTQRTDTPAVRVTGVVRSLPATRAVPSRDGSNDAAAMQRRTAFLLATRRLTNASGTQPTSGTLRVFVEGDATRRVNWGDEITVTGDVEMPSGPRNPGEFDFARYSRRQGICGLLFVSHPLAITVTASDPTVHPRRWLSAARRQVSGLLERHLASANQPLAEALLLGNRGFLDDGTEFAFISSGTMHLLAISGLHVGILYLFLVRCLMLLRVRHQAAILGAFTLCVTYAFLTDLRPSVLRAVVFIGLHVLSQSLSRPVSMSSLIAVTSLLFVLADPNVVGHSGAWLSFLAVAGLSRASARPIINDQDVPQAALEWTDTVRQWASAAGGWLWLRYRQMLAVTAVTAPLVAAQFHVLSAVGLLINVLLIPLTGGILILGFTSIGWGILLPEGPQPAAAAFDIGLDGLRAVVDAAAAWNLGSATVPDLPLWLMIGIHSLIAVAMLRRSGWLRFASCAVLAVALPATLSWAMRAPAPVTPRCTVLDVGHGNAVVVETTSGEVLLFDAGALNRADRTTDIVCQFLWHRGYRRISAVIVSHPDIDHYNGVNGILQRMDVGRLIITSRTARSDVPGPQQMLDTAGQRAIPMTVAMHGDRLTAGQTTVRFLQVPDDETSGRPQEDNDSSLVGIAEFPHARLALPGDLEDVGQALLEEALPKVDVLVSPHHGSPDANTVRTAAIFRPAHVLISARDTDRRDHLTAVFGDSTQLWWTAERGALTVEFRANGVTVTPFLPESRR